MAGRKKQERMDALAGIPFVLEYQDEACFAWEQAFPHLLPYAVEVGCGDAGFTVAHAKLRPEQLIIGVDIKGPRLWAGIREAVARNLKNVAILRMPYNRLATMLPPHSVSDIWITFPDPKPKPCRAKQRPMSPQHLAMYKQILTQDGLVHVKTDSDLVWEYSLEVIAELDLEVVERNDDVQKDLPETNPLSIQTTYERSHRRDGRTIRYVAFKMK